ncbi:hypothetical protein BDV93DRAFT_520288 [Ceratobasidium sp. AG-I]|nr:hypothetical protein BDV93DRAFT_520288 [Ceratobasidium sp. AG-I]
MLLPHLTYPVEKAYRIRWITEIFYAASAIVITLLVVLNCLLILLTCSCLAHHRVCIVALVGYDTITVLTPDPNTTHYDKWWAPAKLPDALKIRSKPAECQPIMLPINTPLRTNSSLPMFSYVLKSDFSLPSEDARAGLRAEATYRANPLNDCRVQDMTFTADLKMFSFKIYTTVQCDRLGDTQQLRVFTVNFFRAVDYVVSPDTILDYLTYQAPRTMTDANDQGRISLYGPPQDTFLNILGVLDGLVIDVVQALLMQYGLWRFRLPTVPVPETGYLIWDSREDERDLLDPTRIVGAAIYSDSYWFGGGYLIDINATIINLLVSVRDAIHLDLGYAAPTNIYLNKTSFDRMISLDNYLVKSLPTIHNSTQIVTIGGACSWVWGCSPNFNTSWAQALISSSEPFNNLTLPIRPTSPIYPSVINLVYLCPQYQRKSWGSLCISVFIGTFTMYATLYGLFAWVGPQLDRKLAGARQKHLSENDEAEQCSLKPSSTSPTIGHFSSFRRLDLPEDFEDHFLRNNRHRDTLSD